MNPTVRTALAVVLICVITLCAIFIVSDLAGRARIVDLTEHKLYTLSEGTKNILAKLNQTVTLKLYYSRTAARKRGPEQIRYWNHYFLYVNDLLAEYVAHSGGKLKLEVIDPRPYSDEEEEAIRYGIRRWQLAKDEPFFFGLVASTELGKDQTIEFFEPNRQRVVEYDVSKLLAALMQREKKKVGVLANVPILGTDMSPYMMQMLRMQGRGSEPPWTIVGRLRLMYDVEPVKLEDKDTAIPDDIDYLMVVHPKDLDEKTRFAIDQFVMKGGRLVVFVDPHSIMDRPTTPMRNQFQAMGHKASSNLNSLLETWGVTMDPDAIAVDRTLAVRTQRDHTRAPEEFPVYLSLTAEEVSKDAPITADLHSVRMLYAGALRKVDGAGTQIKPLLQTSKVGNVWKPSSPFDIRIADAAKILDESGDGTEPVMLACLITGKFKTNFPDGIEVEMEEDDSSDDEDKDKKDAEKKKDEESEDAKKADKADAKKADKADAKKEGEAKKGDEGAPGKAAAKGQPGKKEAPKPKAPPPKADAAKATKPKAPEPKAKKDDAKKAAPPKAKADEKKAKAAEAKKEPEAKKEEEEKEEEEKKTRRLKPLTEAAEGAMVIVVADVDLLSDVCAYRRDFFGPSTTGDNEALVFNILDYLSGSDDLMRIRTRGQYLRDFEVVNKIEQKASKATAIEIKALKDKIEKFEKDIQELGGAATKENITLIQSAALEKRRNLETEVRTANKELRKLQQTRREEVEALGESLQRWNMLAAPFAILLIAITLAVFRWTRAKHYAARRTD